MLLYIFASPFYFLCLYYKVILFAIIYKASFARPFGYIFLFAEVMGLPVLKGPTYIISVQLPWLRHKRSNSGSDGSFAFPTLPENRNPRTSALFLNAFP